MITNQTRVIDLTVGELRAIIDHPHSELNEPKKDVRMLYGLDELGQLLGCGRAKASKLVNQGVFGDALFRVGRKIRIDAGKAMEAYMAFYQKQKNGIL